MKNMNILEGLVQIGLQHMYVNFLLKKVNIVRLQKINPCEITLYMT